MSQIPLFWKRLIYGQIYASFLVEIPAVLLCASEKYRHRRHSTLQVFFLNSEFFSFCTSVHFTGWWSLLYLINCILELQTAVCMKI